MDFTRFLPAITLLLMAGCEQAQVAGPLGGATVTVSELRSGNIVVSNQFTEDEAAAAQRNGDKWNTFNPLQKSWFIGNHYFSGADKASFNDNTWYVIEMAGGFDYYATGTFLQEPSPVQVFGSVHAIVSGARLKEANYLVTPVTEAAYQYVKDFAGLLTNTQLEETLDAVATELVGDADKDGRVDYTDVLKWNRLLHLNLLVDKDRIDALTTAVSAGESSVNDLADSLFASNSPAGVPEQVYENRVSDIIVANACGPGCHIEPGTATQGPFASDNIIRPPSAPEHVTFNTENFRMLVSDKGVDHVLAKVSGGLGHIGGQRLVPGTNGDYETFEAWLTLF